MHRLAPVLDLLELPGGISRGHRSHDAAGLDELSELMTSMLTLAAMRKTGSLPCLRNASNETMSALCIAAEPARTVSLPPMMRFEGGFVRRMLGVWDTHTTRDPEEAAVFLRLATDEYVVGITSRDLVDAIARGDLAAIRRALAESERVLGFSRATAS